jgi:hypothetical protein
MIPFAVDCGVWRSIRRERREKGELFKKKRDSPNLSTFGGSSKI